MENYKSKLQEYMQKRRYKLPRYSSINSDGFISIVRIYINNDEKDFYELTPHGSRKSAERAVAKIAWNYILSINKEPDIEDFELNQLLIKKYLANIEENA